MKKLSKFLIVSGLVLFGLNTAWAQRPSKKDIIQKEARVRKIVNSGDFVFEAEHFRPFMKRFDLVVTKDSVAANLPFTHSVGSKDLRFDCTDFAFNKWRNASGDWDVVIKPKTTMSDVTRVRMVISPYGYASLHVNTDHGNLLYTGYIKQQGYKIGA